MICQLQNIFKGGKVYSYEKFEMQAYSSNLTRLNTATDLKRTQVYAYSCQVKVYGVEGVFGNEEMVLEHVVTSLYY